MSNAVEEAEKLIAGMTRAEKAQILQAVVRELGDAFPGIESRSAVCGGGSVHRSDPHPRVDARATATARSK